MTEFGETIDIRKYHKDYIKTLSEEERLAICHTHVERAKQGYAVWNAWAEKVLAAIEKIYPENADDNKKTEILSQYEIDFVGFNFEQYISFSFFNFPIAVNFREAIFSREGIFFEAIFSGGANFEEVIFSDVAHFWYANFFGKANFTETIFSGKVYFFGVVFSDNIYFSDALFSQKVNLSLIKFIGINQAIIFSGAQFHQQSLFIDIEFTDHSQAMPCDFRQTYFHLPPLVTDFPSDVSTFIQANKDKQRGKDFYKTCEDRFRELKKLAEGNNNHQKSLEFYGCELYCQRRASGGLRNPKNWASYLYGLFSGYGLSLLRPTLLWLAVMLGSMGLQAVLDDKLSFSPTATVNMERVGFYLSPSLPPFINKPLYQKEVRKRLYTNPQNKQLTGQLPAWNRCIRTFQTLVTFISLFLFGLALRNRFKIS